mmetsp:Transcript_2975/g.6540  ORF Transcript_2975/g.6540 Transcript_2975/m.6540 type:complete len:219 (+) Transcript_2975:2461-3117(+)
MSLPLSCSFSKADLHSSTFARALATSFDTPSIWERSFFRRSSASATIFSRSFRSLPASLISCCLVFSRSVHSACWVLMPSISSVTLTVLSRMSCASVCATSTTFRTSVSCFCNGTSSASFCSFGTLSSSAFPFRLAYTSSSAADSAAFFFSALASAFSHSGASLRDSSAVSRSLFAVFFSSSAVFSHSTSFCCLNSMSSVSLTSIFSHSLKSSAAFSI